MVAASEPEDDIWTTTVVRMTVTNVVEFWLMVLVKEDTTWESEAEPEVSATEEKFEIAAELPTEAVGTGCVEFPARGKLPPLLVAVEFVLTDPVPKGKPELPKAGLDVAFMFPVPEVLEKNVHC